MGSQAFAAVGAVEQSFVVPAGVTSIHYVLNGAGGGGPFNGSGVAGPGGKLEGDLTVTPLETIGVRVGVVGANGAASGPGAGGYFQGGNGGDGSAAEGGGGGGQSCLVRAGARSAVAGGGGGASSGPGTVGGNGGVTLDDETDATQVGQAGGPSARGGGGGGWFGGAAATSNTTNSSGGTNMARSTETSGITSTSGGGAAALADGSIVLTWTDPPITFQQAGTLYPVNSSTVDTGAGLDVRALSDTQPGATDSTQSILNSTQASNAERRWDPATASDTTVSNASSANVGEGWAIPLPGMDTGDARCVARLVAQTATVNLSGTASGTGTGGVGANDVLTPRASLWKWNLTTNVGTLIVGGSGAAQTISALLAYSGTAWSATVVLAVPATTFAANEVLMLVCGGNLACGAGLLSGARTTTWVLDVDVSTTSLVFSAGGGGEGLTRKCTVPLAGGLTLGGQRPVKTVRLKAKAAALTLTGVLARHLTLHKTLAAQITLQGVFARRLQLHKTFTAGVTLGGAFRKTVRLGPKQAQLTLTARAPEKHIVKRFAAALSLDGALSKTLTKQLVATITLQGVFDRHLQLQRRFTAALTLNARMFVTISQDILARLSTGVSTVNYFIRRLLSDD